MKAHQTNENWITHKLMLSATRPVTRGSARWANPPRKFFSPLEKCFGYSLKILAVVQKIRAPLRELFAPPGVPSWLRACLQHSALLWFYCKWANVQLCFRRNFSCPGSLIFYCTTWCPDTYKENFVSAAISENALLNERPLAFETAFSVRAVVTAFIIFLITKKERVIKASLWLDLRVALDSRIKILKAHTYFQSFKNNSGRFCKCSFAEWACWRKYLQNL